MFSISLNVKSVLPSCTNEPSGALPTTTASTASYPTFESALYTAEGKLKLKLVRFLISAAVRFTFISEPATGFVPVASL